MRESVAWVHDLAGGEVTAVLVMPRAATRDAGVEAAPPIAEALRTDEVEVLIVPEAGGAPRRDSMVQARVLAVLHDAALSQAVSLGDVGPRDLGSTIRLGVALASGLGVATEVSDPGLAPTPLVARLDLSISVGEATDVGIAGRFQLINVAAMGEVFLRKRLSWLHLRAGFGVGEVTHKIVVTENRRQSTSGFVGPCLGVAIPLGPVELGIHTYAPLYPDATVQIDVSMGAGLDF